MNHWRQASRFMLAAALLLTHEAAAALSGNAQIELVGQGRYEALASGLEQDAQRKPLKTPDLHALCYAYSKLKRYDKIVPCLDQLDRQIAAGDDSARLFGLDDATPSSSLMRAEVLIDLGQYRDAALQAQKTLDWLAAEHSTDLDMKFQALADQVIAWRLAGQRQRAEASLTLLESTGLGLLGSDYRGARAIALARANMAMGRYQAVLDALASDFSLGLRRFLDNINTGALFTGNNNWLWMDLPRAFMAARAQQGLGRQDEARQGLDAILAIPQLASNGEIHWMSLFARGQIALADGDVAKAETLWRSALAVIEAHRASINTEANKIGFVGDKAQVYDALVDLQAARGDAEAVLLTAERAKSRALVDLLADRDEFALPEGPEGERVRAALLALQRAEQRARWQGDASARNDDELKAARELLQKSAPRLAALVAVKAPGLSEIRQLLQPDETVLLFHFTQTRLHIITLSQKTLQLQSVAADGIADEIARLRQDIEEQRPEVDARLRRLHDRLIPAGLRNTASGRLLIVPHKSLHYLPFAALRSDAGYLLERWSLRILPSAGVLPFLPVAAMGYGDSLTLFGNPDLGDSSRDLPAAQQEAEAIAAGTGSADRLHVRNAASKAAFLREARKASALHIASHGEFRGDQPMQSALYLASDAGADGRLTVADLYQLRLRSRLVVLSACETGLGAIASGDDVVGLVRGFLYAGAGAIVSSLWQVDDVATAELMTALYAALPTQNSRDALRQAQLAILQRYPHPFYWAAFFVTGASQ
ncbi:MAG: CHAT domain-containing protein [Pseudomonadota bacterium]